MTQNVVLFCWSLDAAMAVAHHLHEARSPPELCSALLSQASRFVMMLPEAWCG
jgi:hypothetical protein